MESDLSFSFQRFEPILALSQIVLLCWEYTLGQWTNALRKGDGQWTTIHFPQNVQSSCLITSSLDSFGTTTLLTWRFGIYNEPLSLFFLVCSIHLRCIMKSWNLHPPNHCTSFGNSIHNSKIIDHQSHQSWLHTDLLKLSPLTQPTFANLPMMTNPCREWSGFHSMLLSASFARMSTVRSCSNPTCGNTESRPGRDVVSEVVIARRVQEVFPLQVSMLLLKGVPARSLEKRTQKGV